MSLTKPLAEGKTRWKSGCVVVETEGVIIPGIGVELTVTWVHTAAKQRRKGWATEVLRMMKKQVLKQNPECSISVVAIITSKAAYKLFRKVFGRPYLLVNSNGLIHKTEASAVETLPLWTRDAKWLQLTRPSQFVEATFWVAKKGLLKLEPVA